MACLLAPLTEAIIVSAANSIYNKKSSADSVIKESHNKKINVLKQMLYGGSFLLAVEHIYHGEIIFKFPFLTAVQDGNTVEMLKEIGTSGVAMAILVTLIWGVGCKVYDVLKAGKTKVVA